MRVKIFSDKSCLPKDAEPTPLLQPFWRQIRQPALFTRYADIAPRLFELTSLAEAQYAVAPSDWNDLRKNEESRKTFSNWVRQVAHQSKKTILFFYDDAEDPIQGENLLVFRPSLFRPTKRANEFATPAWIPDLASGKQSGQERYRAKKTIPTIGFCGYPHGGFGTNRTFRQHFRWLWALARHRLWGRSLGRYNRGMALQILANSDQVRTHFIINDAFFVKMIRKDETQQRALKNAFLKNTMESDYILCVRGSGNFSYRFYEALCCGRIPVFVDTDCVLPWENVVDYRKYCVWIPERELPSIVDRIMAFHNALSEEEFVVLQKNCRQLWEDHLSPEGYFSKMATWLSSRP